MEEFVTFAALVAIATHVTSVIKYATAWQWRSVTEAMLPIAGLFVVLMLGAAADATAGIVIPGMAVPLGNLDVPSLMLAALAGGSGGATVYNFRRAVDNHDTSVEPPLGGGQSLTGV